MPHAEFLDRLSRQDVRYRIDPQSAVWWSVRYGKWRERLRTIGFAIVLIFVVGICASRFREDPRLVAYALFGVLIGLNSFTGPLAEFSFYLGVLLLTNRERLWFELPVGFDLLVGSSLLPAMLTINIWLKSRNALDTAVRESDRAYEQAVLSGALVLIPYPD